MKLLCMIFAFAWAALFLTACMDQTPSGPSVDLTGSTGNNNVAISTGSSSPVGTAPCASSGAPQKGNGLQAPAPNCSTNTPIEGSPAPVVVPPVVVTNPTPTPGG